MRSSLTGTDIDANGTARAARLLRQSDGREFPLPLGTPRMIGRAIDADISLSDDSQVSTRHATVTFDGHAVQLQDVGSTNGTYVLEQRVHSHVLSEGERFRVGQTTLQVQLPAPVEGASSPVSQPAVADWTIGDREPPSHASAYDDELVGEVLDAPPASNMAPIPDVASAPNMAPASGAEHGGGAAPQPVEPAWMASPYEHRADDAARDGRDDEQRSDTATYPLRRASGSGQPASPPTQSPPIQTPPTQSPPAPRHPAAPLAFADLPAPPEPPADAPRPEVMAWDSPPDAAGEIPLFSLDDWSVDDPVDGSSDAMGRAGADASSDLAPLTEEQSGAAKQARQAR